MPKGSRIAAVALALTLPACPEPRPPASDGTPADRPSGTDAAYDRQSAPGSSPQLAVPAAASVEDHVRAATEHERARNLRAAVDAWTAAIALEPANGRHLLRRANARAGLGLVDATLDDYRAAAALGRVDLPLQLWDWRRARAVAAGRKRPPPDIRLLYGEVQFLRERRFAETVAVREVDDWEPSGGEEIHDRLDHLHPAFYMPASREIVMNRGRLEGVSYEATLVHELAHALDHQHEPSLFAGEVALYGEFVWDHDRDLARRCVVEGSAVLTEWTWRAWTESGVEPTDTGWLDPAYLTGTHGDELEMLPAAVERSTGVAYMDWFRRMSAYGAGVAFMAAVRRAGGPDGVSAALRHPPVSTEQVLHPEKYLVRADTPSEIVLGERPCFEGYELTRADTLGELGLAGLLRRCGASAAGARAGVEGWDGDIYLEFTRTGDAEGVPFFTVVTVWDDLRACTRFYEAMRVLDPKAGAYVIDAIRNVVAVSTLPSGDQSLAFLRKLAASEVRRVE